MHYLIDVVWHNFVFLNGRDLYHYLNFSDIVKQTEGGLESDKNPLKKLKLKKTAKIK